MRLDEAEALVVLADSRGLSLAAVSANILESGTEGGRRGACFGRDRHATLRLCRDGGRPGVSAGLAKLASTIRRRLAGRA